MEMKARLKVSLQLLAMCPALLLVGSSTTALAQETPQTKQQTPQTRGEPQTAPNETKATQTKADRDMTAKVRKAIMDDKTLSSAAHKVSVRTRDGKVTLSGKVNSEEEKENVVAKAKDIAGASNVMDKLTVAPAKAKKAGE
jgi:hyperosmotically inducible protein